MVKKIPDLDLTVVQKCRQSEQHALRAAVTRTVIHVYLKHLVNTHYHSHMEIQNSSDQIYWKKLPTQNEIHFCFIFYSVLHKKKLNLA